MMSKQQDAMAYVPSEEQILAAEKRIEPYAHRTPVFTCSTLDRLLGASLFFKAENLQKVGAFKFRGACNAVFSLDDETAKNGVLTHSSGNHAQALALAAKIRGIPVYIVMPDNAPKVKVDAVKGYGGIVTFCASNQRAREETSGAILKETGANFVHPYNDGRIIAGQATAAKELLSQVSGLDILVAPVGGGGLLSGTALSAKYFSRGGFDDSGKTPVAVFGAEPLAADDAARSFAQRTLLPQLHPDTIADGLRTSLSELTLSIILESVRGILTTSEEEIVRAMRLMWERMKLVVEPSGCVPLAALLHASEAGDKVWKPFAGKKIGVILSGGNVDLEHLPFGSF
jgi:threonine dehydratase